MYEIYINDNKLSLTDSQSVKNNQVSKTTLIAPYSGKTKMLLSYIDMLEKTDRFDEITLHAPKHKRLKKDLESLFKVIRASGGVVRDNSGKILMIFRRGHWDLPKGKIETGEKKKAAALREGEEETGVKELSLGKKIITTRHTYRHHNKRVMKKTYWYTMEAANQKLIPQTEEDIERAEWLTIDEIANLKEPIYGNIVDVLKAYKSIPGMG